MPQNKRLHIIFVTVFLAALITVPLLTALSASGEVSPYEFRALQKLPEFSAKRLWSGEYFSDWESFYKDRFFLRNTWMQMNVFLELNILRRTVVNDVFVSDGHVLPAIPYKPPMTDAEVQSLAAAERVSRVSSLVESYGGSFLYVAMPSQTTAFLNLYPPGLFSDAPNQKVINTAFFASLEKLCVPYVDMCAVYRENGGFDPYFLKTDHHINIHGALLACETAARSIDSISFGVPAYGDIDIYTLPNEVLGSRGRRLFGLSPVNDKIEVFSYKNPVSFTRQDNGQTVEPTVLSLPQADGFTSYSVFMGGDIAETVIRTERPELPNLLIYGDSFTNAMETLLYTGFNETRSIDLRHYTSMGILEYIELYKPDVVLLVRDDHTFIVDTGNGAVR